MPRSCAASMASAIASRWAAPHRVTSARGEPVGERRSLDELDDQGGGDWRATRSLGRHLDDAMYLRDVGMVERRQNLGFAGESREPIGIGSDSRVEHLDGDVAIQLRVAGAMD